MNHSKKSVNNSRYSSGIVNLCYQHNNRMIAYNFPVVLYFQSPSLPPLHLTVNFWGIEWGYLWRSMSYLFIKLLKPPIFLSKGLYAKYISPIAAWWEQECETTSILIFSLSSFYFPPSHIICVFLVVRFEWWATKCKQTALMCQSCHFFFTFL